MNKDLKDLTTEEHIEIHLKNLKAYEKVFETLKKFKEKIQNLENQYEYLVNLINEIQCCSKKENIN